MKILGKTNSKALVKYILTSKKDFKTDKSENNKIDFIVTDKKNPAKKYGIIVRYRNIPDSETRSQVYELTEIKKICINENLIPVIACAIYDEDTNKTYAFLITVEQIENLSQDTDCNEFLREVMHGLEIKFGINRNTSKDLLNKLKMKVDYTEVQQGTINFYD